MNPWWWITTMVTNWVSQARPLPSVGPSDGEGVCSLYFTCICKYLYLYLYVFTYIYIWICLCVTHYCQDLHVPAGSADCVCWLRVCSLLRESKGFCHITLGKALLFRDGWAISTFCCVKNIQSFLDGNLWKWENWSGCIFPKCKYLRVFKQSRFLS